MTEPVPAVADTRPYSPGLEGVIAGETSLSFIDGQHGRLLYRGYPIGELVTRGSYAAIAELLWTDEWIPDARLACQPVPDAVMTALRALPADARPMDALRTAVSVWGAVTNPSWPPTPEQARALTAFSPSALAAFARLRQGLEPVAPDPDLDLVRASSTSSTASGPSRRPPGPSTRTSSWAPSTGSTPRPSPAA